MENSNTRLWFAKPAESWLEAVPIGNGRLGAMIFGGVEHEKLQLNEDTLWSGTPHVYDNPEALGHLPVVRDLIRRRKYEEAQTLAERMLGRPQFQQAYQPLGFIHLDQRHVDGVQDYYRDLDLANGTARVRYRSGDTTYKRRFFASFPDQVIAIRLTCDTPSGLSFDVTMDSPHPSELECAKLGYVKLKGQVGKREEARLIAAWPEDGLKFEAHIRVILTGGSVSESGSGLSVSGADEAIILYAAATGYTNYKSIGDAPSAGIAKRIEDAAEQGYEALLRRHENEYKDLFGRVSLVLPSSDMSKLPTDERLARIGEHDPDLAALFFQYGRYLLISSSRTGTQAANLQGIWNDTMDPPWGSKYTININIQMNYWPAMVCNLDECTEPLFRLIEDIAERGVSTARVHYDAGGWVAHHNTDLWRGTAGVDGATWGMWPMGAAWLCQHLWEYFLFTEDKNHLVSVYPLMKGAAEFFLDTLIEDVNGDLITSPSISPEHAHKNGTGNERDGSTICEGPAMDRQILADLFSNCAQASTILGVDEEFRQAIQDTARRLSPMEIGRHGQLQEWLDDWDSPDDHHGHISHLYGAYPSGQINPEQTPDLFEAARKSLEFRGPHGGWPGAWQVSLWARFGDGNRSHDVLMDHIIPHVSKNLFNGKRVYQIDANLGATAGIAEMLLQSHMGHIHLLPALPDAWPTGSVTGLRARGGFEVDIEWADGKLVSARVLSLLGNQCRIRHARVAVEFDTVKGAVYALSSDLAHRLTS
jgi:alpha-L-fucosidase 2